MRMHILRDIRMHLPFHHIVQPRSRSCYTMCHSQVAVAAAITRIACIRPIRQTLSCRIIAHRISRRSDARSIVTWIICQETTACKYSQQRKTWINGILTSQRRKALSAVCTVNTCGNTSRVHENASTSTHNADTAGPSCLHRQTWN